MTTNNSNTVFKHVYGGVELRTLVDEKGIWLVFTDICKGLGLKAHHTVLKKLCDFEVANGDSLTITGRRAGKAPKIVSESGFYKLVMRSDKPEAVQFQRWVCEEVLPEIRRTGSYTANPASAPAIIKDIAKLNPDDCVYLSAREYADLQTLDPARGIHSFLGRIATRLCKEQNKGKRFRPLAFSGRWYGGKQNSIGEYPVSILEEALRLYNQGLRE